MRQSQLSAWGGSLERGSCKPRVARMPLSLIISIYSSLQSFQPLSGVPWKVLASLPHAIFCWVALRVLLVHDAVTRSDISCVPKCRACPAFDFESLLFLLPGAVVA